MKIIVALIISMFLVHPDAKILGALVYNDRTIKVEGEEAASVLRALEDDLGVLMTVYWKKKERTGCDKTKEITLHLSNQSALVVLERITQQLGNDESEATWQLRDGVVEVGLKSKLMQKQFHRLETYPIMDLVFNVRSFAVTERGNGSGSIESALQKQQRIDEIIEKITKFVEPEVWEQNGGDCTITNYNETLLVRAPNFVHRQLGGYPFAPVKPDDVPARSVQFNGNRTSVTINNN